MSKDILLRLEGQDHASDLRDQFLSSYDNETRESIIIDVEMTTIPVLLGICFLIGQYLICIIIFRGWDLCAKKCWLPQSVNCSGPRLFFKACSFLWKLIQSYLIGWALLLNIYKQLNHVNIWTFSPGQTLCPYLSICSGNGPFQSYNRWFKQ